MLRGEHLWSSGSVAAVFAPKLADAPSTSSFSADLGATNARNRGQFSLAYRPGERINAELLAYREEGSDVRWGASFSALVSDATVVRAEGTHSREPSLASRAAVANGPAQSGQRLNLGLTYTTSTRLSLTAEYQYNRFALDRSGWEALRLAGPDAVIGYYGQALALQDNAARDALFLQAVQEDFALKKLDLTALLRLNLTDDSRLIWLNLRYKLERFDVALRVQSNSGETGSEFGSATIRNSALVLVTAYF
jgi:hypothetical protein